MCVACILTVLFDYTNMLLIKTVPSPWIAKGECASLFGAIVHPVTVCYFCQSFASSVSVSCLVLVFRLDPNPNPNP